MRNVIVTLLPFSGGVPVTQPVPALGTFGAVLAVLALLLLARRRLV